MMAFGGDVAIINTEPGYSGAMGLEFLPNPVFTPSAGITGWPGTLSIIQNGSGLHAGPPCFKRNKTWLVASSPFSLALTLSSGTIPPDVWSLSSTFMFGAVSRQPGYAETFSGPFSRLHFSELKPTLSLLTASLQPISLQLPGRLLLSPHPGPFHLPHQTHSCLLSFRIDLILLPPLILFSPSFRNHLLLNSMFWHVGPGLCGGC